tara:strand:- start:294 stop:2996 length:2703 start_codon:yes stop_codon:yes gene_type:complete
MSQYNYHEILSKWWTCVTSVLLPLFFGGVLFAYKKKNSQGGNFWNTMYWIILFLTLGISISSIVLFAIKQETYMKHNSDIPVNGYLVPFLFSILFLTTTIVFPIAEYIKRDYTDFINKLSVFFETAINFFITSKIPENVRKYIYIGISLISIIPIFIFLIPAIQNPDNILNWGKFIISTIFILFMLFVSLGLISSEFKNKYGFKLLKIMMYRKNITWSVFFISFLSFAIPFLVNNRTQVKKEETEELFKCNTGKRGDTPTKKCKDDVFDESKEKINKVEMPFYIVLFLMLALLFGLNTGKVNYYFSKDPFKSLVTLLCLGIFMSFIVFQIQSERVFGENDEREVSDATYKTGNIIYLILGFIGLFSLLKVNTNYGDRPSYDDFMKNVFWLFEKFRSDFLTSALYFAGLLAFVTVFYVLLSKRSINLGITTSVVQLVYLMVGLSLMIMLYKVLIKSDFMRRFPVLKILVNLIFFIPCILFGIVEFLYNDFKNTPKVVYVLLLGQIILVSCYVLIPLIVKNLYGLVKIKRNSSELNELKKKTTKQAVNGKKEQIKVLKNPVSDKVSETMWNNIIGEKLYNDVNKLHTYLASKTNIQDRKGYINETVKNKVTEKLDDNTETEIWNNINRDLWETNCNTEISNCGKATTEAGSTATSISSLNCNLAYYTVYIYLVGKEISDKMDELTIMETKKKKADEENRKYFSTNTQLVNKPIYLDRKTETDKSFQNLDDCGTYDFSGNFIHSGVADCNQSYNYGLSLWVNLHAQPPNQNPSYNKYATIINYSNNPKISYNMKKNKLKVEILRNGSPKEMFTIFEKNVLKMQKWNNIVINYNLGIVEIFVNSKLVASNDVILPYVKSDKIEIGEINGISGGICNVVYYPTKLTKTEINLLYNSLKLRNPPIA